MSQDPEEPTRRRAPGQAAETPPRPRAGERREPTGAQPEPTEERREPARTMQAPSAPAAQPALRVSRDPRAVIVAVAGLAAVGLIALIGFLLLPGPVAEGATDTSGAYIVAIASAALTAVATMVAAYFGVKAANVAREATERASLRHEIRIAALAGAAPTAAAAEASRDATEQIRDLGL